MWARGGGDAVRPGAVLVMRFVCNYGGCCALRFGLCGKGRDGFVSGRLTPILRTMAVVRGSRGGIDSGIRIGNVGVVAISWANYFAHSCRGFASTCGQWLSPTFARPKEPVLESAPLFRVVGGCSPAAVARCFVVQGVVVWVTTESSAG